MTGDGAALAVHMAIEHFITDQVGNLKRLERRFPEGRLHITPGASEIEVDENRSMVGWMPDVAHA